MLWSTIRLMWRMPANRRRLWEAYRAFRRCRVEGIALLDVSSGFVFR